MLKALLSSLFCVLLSAKAFAGFMFEPYLGYESQKVAGSTSGVDIGGTGSAIDLGARIGWGFGLGFWSAIDVMTATGGKYSPTTTLTSTFTYTKTDMGLSLGYDFPIKLRTYLTYNFNPSWDLTTETLGVSTATKYSGGTSYKIGLGYSLIAMLTLNFEYYSNTPSSSSSAGVTTTLPATAGDSLTETGYRLVLSMPIRM